MIRIEVFAVGVSFFQILFNKTTISTSILTLTFAYSIEKKLFCWIFFWTKYFPQVTVASSYRHLFFEHVIAVMKRFCFPPSHLVGCNAVPHDEFSVLRGTDTQPGGVKWQSLKTHTKNPCLLHPVNKKVLSVSSNFAIQTPARLFAARLHLIQTHLTWLRLAARNSRCSFDLCLNLPNVYLDSAAQCMA